MVLPEAGNGVGWLPGVLALGPADRRVVEELIGRVHRAAGLPGLRSVVWVRSPLEGTALMIRLRHLWRGTRLPLIPPEQGPLTEAIARLQTPLLRCAGDARRAWQVRAARWSFQRRIVLARLGAELVPHPPTIWQRGPEAMQPRIDEMRSEVKQMSQEKPSSRVPFFDEVPDDSLLLAACDLVGSDLPAPAELRPVLMLGRSCGWWWPLPGLVIVSEPPLGISRDEEGRLHGAAGPALTYRDGWCVHAWHGVAVPEAIITRPESLRPMALFRQANQEVRRVVLERYDLERLLRSRFVVLIEEQQDRMLFRIDLAGEAPFHGMKVTCPSTGRVYVLRVPPAVRTCQEAVAWTFGLSSEEYRPLQET
jgi:hypothetical protein